MIIKDDNRFRNFDDFEKHVLAASGAMQAVSVDVDHVTPCRRCRAEWHGGIVLLDGEVDIYVDSEGLEIIADDPRIAISAWLGMNGHDLLSERIPDSMYAIRELRWASGLQG